MKTGKRGIDLIRRFEGCELKAYKDAVGIPTIGYGHIKDVHMGMEISMDQAIEFLKEDLAEAENAVKKYVKVKLNHNQFDALVSWTFNLGSGNLKSSTMLKRINAKEWDDVPNQIKRWNRAGGKVLKGLTRRRAAEALLWQGKDWKYFDDYDNAPKLNILDKLSDELSDIDIEPPF
jgi:lysozyme